MPNLEGLPLFLFIVGMLIGAAALMGGGFLVSTFGWAGAFFSLLGFVVLIGIVVKVFGDD